MCKRVSAQDTYDRFKVSGINILQDHVAIEKIYIIRPVSVFFCYPSNVIIAIFGPHALDNLFSLLFRVHIASQCPNIANCQSFRFSRHVARDKAARLPIQICVHSPAVENI